jgi:hypothetical protein
MSQTVHSVKLIPYDAVDLNKLSYSNGDVVYDVTNNTLRVMNGSTEGGTSIATEPWVQANAITLANLNTNLSAILSNYVETTTLSGYVTTGELTTALSGVASTYTLPTASTSVLGGVKVDGTTITISNGVISGANTYTLPIAQAATGGDTLGGVIPDGTTITINPSTGVISGANTYVLPSATSSTLGGVKIPAVGTSGITNTLGVIGLATASNTQLGGVIVDGSTIVISSGVISATQYTLPAATSSTLGGVIIGSTVVSGLINTSGSIKIATASISQLGGVKVDGSTITISNGVITANLPSAITFAGTWSAASNTPLLQNGTGTNGYEYVCNAAGTVNFGAGATTFAVGDIVIYTSGVWTRIPASSSSGTTNNTVTFATTGGASSGTSFNGSSAVTVSYATVGAEVAGGSSDITTVGVITTGTWESNLISPTYGGTGTNNGSNTLSLAGNVSFVGAYATSITSTAASTVTLPTQGTLISSVSPLPGAVTGTPSSTTYLRGDGTWAAVSAGGGGTVTSVTGTGTVSGLTLTSSGTSAVTLTLGGTLSISNLTSSNLSSTAGITNGQLANSSITVGSTSISLGSSATTIAGITQITASSVISTSQIYNYAPNPTALTATATLTIAQLLTNIITVTSTGAVILTLPTGTATDAGILSGNLPTNESFDWVIINLGSSSGAITMAAGTGHTYVGSATIAISTSAGFRTRKTTPNTYVTYRIH